MVDSLLASLGLYGATFAVAFIAGVFPAFSIELFLAGATALGVDVHTLVLLIAIAAVGHQIAKTVTYFAGARAFELPRGKVRAQIDAARGHIDRWNRRPRLVMFLSAATGLPPLYLLGFLARPVMHMSLTTFTAISLVGRILRYAAFVVVIELI